MVEDAIFDFLRYSIKFWFSNMFVKAAFVRKATSATRSSTLIVFASGGYKPAAL
jgi:hypothetical protein